MTIAEIRAYAETQTQNEPESPITFEPSIEVIKKPFKDRLNELYGDIGLVLGLVVFTCTLGIILGFITYTVIGFKTMIKKIGNSTHKKGEIINGSCETPEENLLKGGSEDEHS